MQALAKFQTSHEQSTRSGIEQEESMLSESHARETSLNSQILELEMDARHVSVPRLVRSNILGWELLDTIMTCLECV